MVTQSDLNRFLRLTPSARTTATRRTTSASSRTPKSSAWSRIYCSYGLLSSIFKWLTLALFAYVVTAFIVRADWVAWVLAAGIPALINEDRMVQAHRA
jgi:hypothetical protein